jgi:hypothetical protein
MPPSLLRTKPEPDKMPGVESGIPGSLTYFQLIFLAFTFWFASDIMSWVFAKGGPRPVLSYLAFLSFSVFVMFIRLLQGVGKIERPAWMRARRILLWSYGFFVWTLMSFIMSSQSAVAEQRVITQIEILLILCGFLLWLLNSHLHRPLGYVMVAVAVLGSVLNIYDFLVPTFTAVVGRAAGLYVNPTLSGSMLVLAMTCGIPALTVSRRWILLLPASLAIALTFSRTAWLILGITVLWFMWQGYFGGRASRLILVLTAIFTVGLLGSAMFSGSLAEMVLASPIGPYLDSNTLARLGGSEFATDSSAKERANVAKFAISSFLSSTYPLVGYGIGHTHEWSMPVSTHNMYLLHLVEGGIIGLSFFVSLLVLLWRNASAISRLVVLQIAVNSFFDHNVLDSPGRVLFIAIAASGALSYTSVCNRPNKKAT